MKAWTLFSPSGELGRPCSYCQLWDPFPLPLPCVSSAPPFFACISYMSHFSFCSSGGDDHSELGRAVFSSGRFCTEPHGCFSLSLSLSLLLQSSGMLWRLPAQAHSSPDYLHPKEARIQEVPVHPVFVPFSPSTWVSFSSPNLFPAPSRQESLWCRGDCSCLIRFGLFFLSNELCYRSTLHFTMRSDFWGKKCKSWSSSTTLCLVCFIVLI